jgi:hypothetical protein
MPDMLVKLYELPPVDPACEELRQGGVEVRRALPPEKHIVVGWVGDTFGRHWASECEVSFARSQPGIYRGMLRAADAPG